MSTALAHTVAMVRLARAMGAATPRRRMPRQQYPHLLEVEYGRILRGVVNAARGALAGLEHITTAHEAVALIEGARRRVAAMVPRLVPTIARIATRTVDHQAAQLDAQTRAALGIGIDMLGIAKHTAVPASVHMDARTPSQNVDARIEGFISENVALIKSLGDTPLEEIEQMVTRAFAAGDRHETLASAIVERWGVAENRAALIARDQIGKLNGRISADRHQRMGLTRFYWRDVGDQRVRPEHRKLAKGGPYEYARPPAEGLPGEPIQCRCHDEPIFDDVLAELDRLEAQTAPQIAPQLPPARRPRAPRTPRVVTPPPAPQPVHVAPPAPDPRAGIAKRIVEVAGTATHEDVDAVLHVVARMPHAVLDDLERASVRIAVGRGSVTDVLPDLRGVTPRGWPPGSTWDSVPGLYSHRLKRVVVSTEQGPVGRRAGSMHGSVNLTLHESGHALDAVHGDESHSDAAFRAAYEADVRAGALRQYYLQPGHAGIEEAYAESFAIFVEHGTPMKGFSAMVRYWTDRYAAHP